MRDREATLTIAAGPLPGLIWRSMPGHRPSFERLAQGLKPLAESGG
jgi:hypothetical protein